MMRVGMFLTTLIIGAQAIAGIVELSNIYDDKFTYFLPQATIVDYLKGGGFDYDGEYTESERLSINIDIEEIYKSYCGTVSEPIAVISAGAPGAGKTVLLEQLLKLDEYQGYGYIDPDAVCLKNMSHTYLPDLIRSVGTIKCSSYEECLKEELKVRKDAYTKWRPASNAAAHIILGNFIREKKAFFYGTTSTSSDIAARFQLLKDNGYKIHLIHVSAPDAVRWKSIHLRDKEFVQTTEVDVNEKGKLVPQRLGTYLQYADKIDFYYRDRADGDAVLAATWTKDSKSLMVKSNSAYPNMVELHDSACAKLERTDISWGESLLAMCNLSQQ